jgi:hypothetical protein
MANPWELICHHAYGGIAGVVADRSPSSASDARVFGIPDEDFLPDGARPDTGAIRFRQQSGSVRIPAMTAPWRLLEGLRVEALVRRESAHKNFIIDCNAFRFFIENDQGNEGHLIARFVDASGASVQIDSVNDAVAGPFGVDRDRWVALGFVYDGFSEIELHVDGIVVARKVGLIDTLTSIDGAGVRIGQSRDGLHSFLGEIDGLKIWRRNPRRFYDDFHARPMNPETAACWRKFDEQLQAAQRRHPECSTRLNEELRQSLRNAVWSVISGGPDAAARFAEFVKEYQRLWRAGKVGSPEMIACIAGFIEWLQSVGLDGALSAGASELGNSVCFQIIAKEAGAPECDRQLKHLYEQVAARLSGRNERTKA